MTRAETVKTEARADVFVTDYLKEHHAGVEFSVTEHDWADTSQKAASRARVKGKDFGKGVLVELHHHAKDKQEDEVVMCIVRAPDHVLLDKLAKMLGAREAVLCPEGKVVDMLDRLQLPVDPGVVVPLPALYGVRGFMDSQMARHHLVHFKAGSHHKLVTMAMNDFMALTKPTVLPFAEELDVHLKAVTSMLMRCGYVVPHGIIRHSPAMTAQETAAAVHIPGSRMIKAVIVNLDGKLAMCAVDAGHVVDLQALAKVAGAQEAQVATPQEFQDRFPGTQPGAIPPFGHLFDMKLYIDSALGKLAAQDNGEIAFNAGTYTEAMTMSFDDYLKVNKTFAEPVVAEITRPETAEDHQWTSSQVKKFLHNHNVPCMSIKHPRAFTAPEIAHAAGISGKMLAKTVVVEAKGELALAAVRADDMLDLDKLNEAGCTEAGLEGGGQFTVATEEAFVDKFKNVEPGAMPPLGNLYNMGTFVDSKLAQNDMIYMNAGTHKELIGVKWDDLFKVVKPTVCPISKPHPQRAQATV